MIEDVKINSEDYSRNYVLNNKGTPIGSDPYPYYIQRNGQVIYPIWFITETKKNIDSIQIKAIHVHMIIEKVCNWFCMEFSHVNQYVLIL